jgi:aminopeptidase C
VVAIFFLTDDEWMAFSNFYEDYPMGILTQNELDVRRRRKSLRTSGHAVVLTSYNSKCLTFMNSWGQKWGDNGFFRVQNAEVLQLEFFDVYWTLNDLIEGEKECYHQRGSEDDELVERLAKSGIHLPRM